jgi:hypothetical protein
VVFRWNRPVVSQALAVELELGEARQLTYTGQVTYGLELRPEHDELITILDDGGGEQF